MDFLSSYLDDPDESQRPASTGKLPDSKMRTGNGRKLSLSIGARPQGGPGASREGRKPIAPGRLKLGGLDDKQKRLQETQDFIPPLIIDGDSMLMTPQPQHDRQDPFLLSPMADYMPTFSKIDSMRTVFLTPKSIMRRPAPQKADPETETQAQPRQPNEDTPMNNSFFDFFRGSTTN